jgi:RNA methyltransferase, TrmH family
MSETAMITSSSNTRVKQIRKLVRDRKERQESKLFYIEGLRIVTEAAQVGAKIESLLVAPELVQSLHGRSLIEEQRKLGVPLINVSGEVFKSISLKEGPQGIAAVVWQDWLSIEQLRINQKSHWIALDAVADPGNLGTIMRTHDAVGGEGIILLDHATDPYDPTALRASMGAVFSQKLVRASFEEFAHWKHTQSIPLIGSSGQGAVDYQSIVYPQPMVLLMGSERQGLQEHHLALCDSIVRIPMIGRSDSLNLAVATAIILYEIFNQQRGKSA